MREQLFAMLLTLLVVVASTSAFCGQGVCGLLTSSSKLQGGSLDQYEERVVALVNGTRAYGYDLELESIALARPDFRSAGSIGANETANWIKAQFESFGLEAWLEPFEFTNWTLLEKPSLIIDVDGDQGTIGDQVVIDSFQCEHYSWPTPEEGVFADLVILPLPPAADHTEIGKTPIDTIAWDEVNTTGKILLIGREVRMHPNWAQPFVNKLQLQPPAAVVYTWWYDWMNFTPPLYASAAVAHWAIMVPTFGIWKFQQAL